MTDTVLTNARILLPDGLIHGSILIRQGVVVDVSTGPAPRDALDCDRDLILPGLVELHTDNLERHIEPRPKVDWPHRAAILAHDGELAACGITTVFDALRLGSDNDPEGELGEYARQLADDILDLRAEGALRIDHRIHLRAEVCSVTLMAELDRFGPEDGVGIVSLMDHTPGQRQFRDIDKLRAYVIGKRGLSEEGFQAKIAAEQALGERVRDSHEAATVAACRRYGATLASHDDTTAEQVMASHAFGARLAEFPTTHEAAEACRAHGIAVMMGAPNLIRGGSHSGNVAARALAEADLLDIVSSDYVPAALLMAGLMLGDLWDDLPRGMATVSANPAASVGLRDRGLIAPGMRADLIRVRRLDGGARVRGTWVQGQRVG
jgi:alpha-D-ribose 1-methylphosphonate 5-triphosphate diphosphatase